MSALALDLARVRVRKVQVVVAANEIVPGLARSGLWPRVVFELDGKEKRVAFTKYASAKGSVNKHDPLMRSDVGGEILRMCGRASNTTLDKEDREALKKSLALARSVITRALKKAGAKGGRYGKRVETEQRKAVRQKVLKDIEMLLNRMFLPKAKLADMQLATPAMVGQVWKKLLDAQTVATVIES